MREGEYETDDIAAYGAQAQPAIAARMSPQLRLVAAGVAAAGLAVATGAAALAQYPSFGPAGSGLVGAVVAVLAAVAMLAVAVIQLIAWRRAIASWRGERVQDLHAERRLSWIAHAFSYVVVLASLLSAMAGSAYAGWSSPAAALLAVSLFFVLVSQVLAGVQYLRASGPPGTLPAHLRRLLERSR